MHGTDPVMDWDSDFGIHVAIYLSLVLLFFCLLPLACYYIRVESKTLAKICPPRSCRRRQPRIRPQRYDIGIGYGMGIDRQGNVFTVPEERSHNRYGDIFFIEPGSEEANRIREQLEKDEKELPSYDEVMRMCNLTTPTSAAAPLPQSALPEPLGPIGIPALPAPPYSETDPHLDASGATVIAMEPVQPSTSRAAQILPTAAPPATPSPATQTTV
ncbi:uncharacterized protein Dana_GF11144, isoform E [Drosophila ananassae]|uniref:Uncharacterized protein, isoform E n=1 Tax=Drosophila ananassae TaxID=7217 RepID=A0A0P8XRI1_DROAN|nr:uncharacterized protein LOC6494009 isoform X3 [Drosophila ananassae]KPU77185.1 uncharacterized protein Dana_GF11144, isoform E [Drosophila ananassae]